MWQISDDGQIHTLEIVGTNKSDSGQYMCHAENSAGLVIHTCSLVISHSKFTQPHGTDSLKSRYSSFSWWLISLLFGPFIESKFVLHMSI